MRILFIVTLFKSLQQICKFLYLFEGLDPPFTLPLTIKSCMLSLSTSKNLSQLIMLLIVLYALHLNLIFFQLITCCHLLLLVSAQLSHSLFLSSTQKTIPMFFIVCLSLLQCFIRKESFSVLPGYPSFFQCVLSFPEGARIYTFTHFFA